MNGFALNVLDLMKAISNSRSQNSPDHSSVSSNSDHPKFQMHECIIKGFEYSF